MAADAELLTPERLPPPPRPLSRFAATRVALHRARSMVLFWVGGAFLLSGLVLAATFIPSTLRDRTLAREGAATVATVVGKDAYTRRGQNGNRIVTLFGRTLLALGPSFAVLFPAVFVGVGFFLFRSGLRQVVDPVRLYRSGEAVTGRVDGFETVTNERLNGRHPVLVHYSFRDRTGAEHEGAVKAMDRALLKVLREGCAATVLYDGREPRRSTLFAALGLQTPAVGAGIRSPSQGGLG
jgi:hypothetical protein